MRARMQALTRSTVLIPPSPLDLDRDRRKGEGFRIYCETQKNVDDLAKRIEAKGGAWT